MDDFIPNGANIDDRSTRKWLQYANLSKEDLRRRWNTPIGRGILQALLTEHLSRAVLQQQLGKFNGKFDLRGVPLVNCNLSQHDLTDIDFFAANLSGADLTGSDLSRSYLSESDLRRTKLNWVRLDGTYLDNALFDNDTSFLGVDLNAPNFTLATLLYDLASSQQRIEHLKKRHPIFSFFLSVTCDYGRSFALYTVWVIFFIGSYAVAYWKIPSLLTEQQFQRSFLDCLYFSVVTFAAVGSEGVSPNGPIGEVVVISEISLGYLMGGLLVAILAKRVLG